MPNQTQCQKNLALPPQPNGAFQNYSIVRPGYRGVRFWDTKYTVGIHRTYCHSICAEIFFVSTDFYASWKQTITAMTVKLIDKRTHIISPVIWQLWSYLQGQGHSVLITQIFVMLQLLRPNSSNLPCLYSTFHLEYPLVLSRFWFLYTWPLWLQFIEYNFWDFLL